MGGLSLWGVLRLLTSMIALSTSHNIPNYWTGCPIHEPRFSLYCRSHWPIKTNEVVPIDAFPWGSMYSRFMTNLEIHRTQLWLKHVESTYKDLKEPARLPPIPIWNQRSPFMNTLKPPSLQPLGTQKHVTVQENLRTVLRLDFQLLTPTLRSLYCSKVRF